MSKKYTGYSCSICDKVFQDDDDVVTCPECGTPFHRECYLNVGHCPYESQHKTMASWSESIQQKNSNPSLGSDVAPLICTQCGAENPADGLFCTKCGKPLGTPQSIPFSPFNPLFPYPTNVNPNGENPKPVPLNPLDLYQPFKFEENTDPIGDYSTDDIKTVVGSNPSYFLRIFRQLENKKFPLSTNWSAFFFGPFYLLYRKMYLPGILYFIAQMGYHVFLLYTSFISIPYMDLNNIASFTANSLPSNIQQYYMYLSSFSSFLIFLGLLSGIFFNYFYKNKVFRLIQKSKDQYPDQPIEQKQFLQSKGGISQALLISSIFLIILIYVLFILIAPYFL